MYVKTKYACIIYLILCNAYMYSIYMRASYSLPYFAIEFTKITQFAWTGMLEATSVHLLFINR